MHYFSLVCYPDGVLCLRTFAMSWPCFMSRSLTMNSDSSSGFLLCQLVHLRYKNLSISNSLVNSLTQFLFCFSVNTELVIYLNIWAAFFPAEYSDVRKPSRVDPYLFHRWLKWKESRLTLNSFQCFTRRWCSMQTMTHLGNLSIIQLPKPDQHLLFIRMTNMFKDIEWSHWAESCGCGECGQKL